MPLQNMEIFNKKYEIWLWNKWNKDILRCYRIFTHDVFSTYLKVFVSYIWVRTCRLVISCNECSKNRGTMNVLQLNLNFWCWIVHKAEVVSWTDSKNSVLIFVVNSRSKNITDTDKSKVVFKIICPRRFQNTPTFFLDISSSLFGSLSKSQSGLITLLWLICLFD